MVFQVNYMYVVNLLDISNQGPVFNMCESETTEYFWGDLTQISRLLYEKIQHVFEAQTNPDLMLFVPKWHKIK